MEKIGGGCERLHPQEKETAPDAEVRAREKIEARAYATGKGGVNMEEKRSKILTEAMERAGKLMALHCEIAENVARANVQFMVGPDAELVETKGVDLAESSLCAVERISVVLERLADAERNYGEKEDRMECIVIPGKEPRGHKTETMMDGRICVIPEKERRMVVVRRCGQENVLELEEEEALHLEQILKEICESFDEGM